MLTPISLPAPWATTGIALLWTAADAVNGNRFLASGRDLILARNAGTTERNLTVKSFPVPRTGDAVSIVGIIGPDYPATVLADSPRFYYRLGESAGPTATDSSGNGRPATYSTANLVYSRPGAIYDGINTAVQFLGGADTVGNSFLDLSTALAGYSGDKTIEFWFKRAANPPDNRYIFDSGGDPRLVIYLSSAGVYTWADNGNVRALADAGPLNAWDHVVMTFSGPTVRAWVNGIGGSAVNMGAGFNFGNPHPANTRMMAAWSSTNANASRQVTGELDEVAFYPHVLSDARIAAHRDAGLGVGITGRYYAFGPIPSLGWEQPDGYVHVDANHGEVELAIVRV